MIKPLNILELSIIGGIPCYLIYCIYSYICTKFALKEIKKNLEQDEYIIYETKLISLYSFWLPFAFGGMFGK